MAPRMTTTSYAVLGLLALRPWTGYDLTQQASRSLRYAWPKSERLLYSEPKKLVELGHATTHKEQIGSRTRNVYEITDQGRQVLSEWVAMPTTPPQFEAEALLRLLFADHGTVDDLSASLNQLKTSTRELHASVVGLMSGYLEGKHPFPDRTHLSVLFATFQIELFNLIERWVNFALQEIAGWPTTKDLGMNERTELITRIVSAGESVLNHPQLADAEPDPSEHEKMAGG